MGAFKNLLTPTESRACDLVGIDFDQFVRSQIDSFLSQADEITKRNLTRELSTITQQITQLPLDEQTALLDLIKLRLEPNGEPVP